MNKNPAPGERTEVPLELIFLTGISQRSATTGGMVRIYKNTIKLTHKGKKDKIQKKMCIIKEETQMTSILKIFNFINNQINAKRNHKMSLHTRQICII